MIAKLARFSNDCYHILKAPAGSKTSILRGLVFSGRKKMGFRIACFDRLTLRHLYREIFARQHYYFRAETDSPLVLDCGANLGMASIYFKWLYPKCRVQAFEPDPTTFKLLERNIACNNLNVDAHNCALWDEDGEVNLFVDSSNPGTGLMSTDPLRLKGKPIKVPARKLSDFIRAPVDFLKLDVEGAEHRVMRDLEQTGRLLEVRQMVIEYHHRIGNRKSCLADFLGILERGGFQYQIHASLFPETSKDTYQDILIRACR